MLGRCQIVMHDAVATLDEVYGLSVNFTDESDEDEY